MRETRNKKMFRLLIGFSFALLLILAMPLIFPKNVHAEAQETCPYTGDWDKVEDIDAQSYNYVAPDGKQVVEVCYKAGTTVKYETIDPPKSSFKVITDVPNPNENAFEDISHASFRLAEEVKQEEQPFVRITYICTADIAGIVEGYELEVEPGDHIWRVRHESGPTTSFSTNFLSDVQGFINVGETLYFVTPQFANGVKVITSPLANLYQGTASVSGAVCDVPEEKNDPEELTLVGECLGDGNIEWKVTNPNDFSIQFSWKTNDDQNGDLEVPANSFMTFTTTSTGSMIYLSYSIAEEPMSIEQSVEACKDSEEEPKEEPKESIDPEPDMPAGGLAPSLLASITPIVIGISGFSGLTALVIKSKHKKNN